MSNAVIQMILAAIEDGIVTNGEVGFALLELVAREGTGDVLDELPADVVRDLELFLEDLPQSALGWETYLPPRSVTFATAEAARSWLVEQRRDGARGAEILRTYFLLRRQQAGGGT